MLEKQSFILEEILRQLTLLNVNFGSGSQPMTSHNVQIPSGSSSDASTSLSLPPPVHTSAATSSPISSGETSSSLPRASGLTYGATSQTSPSWSTLSAAVTSMAVPQSADSAEKVKTQNSALRGEYVNLYHLLDRDIDMANEYEPTMTNDNEGPVSFKLKKSKRCIDNFGTWLTAWNKYELLIMQYRPNIINIS